MSNNGSSPLVLWYNQLGMNDVDRVGGKNASLGEMITNLSGMGVSVPNGFATTADAFNQFLDQSGVNQRIYELLDKTDIDDVTQLAKAGAQIRQWIIDTPFQPELENAIREAYAQLSADDENASFAVRSSATAEDMPDASFAGQQETFLNVQGFDAVLVAVKHVFASLFNDRAISYRVHQGYDHRGVALSAGVQRMVRSDLASSGVMFSIDTESGFDQVVFITSAWGLGEMVVQGAVNPDEFYVHKPTLAANRPAIVRRTMGSKKIRMVYAPTQEHGKQVKIEDVPQEQRDIFSLTNEEVQELAKQAVQIEKHYGRPMDIEWAKDGHTGKLFIVQARPETVRSRGQVMERYTLHSQGKIIAEGRAIGHRIGAGPVKVIHDISEMNRIEPGDVLVTDMTDPDWEPIMKKASAIVTNRGGRTCHAAIIARELGIPAVVGWNANDCMYDDCPWYVGRPGNLGDRPGNLAVQNSDLVFSVGSRLSIRQVGYNYKTWAREAYVIVNDIDPEELKKPSVHVDMPVHADVKDLLTVMDEVLSEEGKADGAASMTQEYKDAQAEWLRICQGWKHDYPVVLPKHMNGGTETEANVYAFAYEMSRRLNENQIVVVGNGSANVVCGHANIVKKGQRFISNSGIASMGYGLPASIGACVADHSQDIILITGYVSIQMNLQELETVVSHRMPIKIFIINNGGYHSIRQTQKNFFGEPLIGIGVDSGDLGFPSMEKLAWAYGFPYVSIHGNKELGEKVEETLAMDGPVICEVFVTLDQNFEPKSAAKRLPDGTLVSPPLEDLSPFLPDEEMDRIMLIPRIKK